MTAVAIAFIIGFLLSVFLRWTEDHDDNCGF